MNDRSKRVVLLLNAKERALLDTLVAQMQQAEPGRNATRQDVLRVAFLHYAKLITELEGATP